MKGEKSSKPMELMDQSAKEEPKVEREFIMEQTCENRKIISWHLQEKKKKADNVWTKINDKFKSFFFSKFSLADLQR